MQIDLLYFDGCPSWLQGLDNLKIALAAESLQAEIRLIKVEDNAEAEQRKFLGSPSFQVDNLDLWPEERSGYSLSCRVYPTGQEMRGTPTIDMLREKLRAANMKLEG